MVGEVNARVHANGLCGVRVTMARSVLIVRNLDFSPPEGRLQADAGQEDPRSKRSVHNTEGFEPMWIGWLGEGSEHERGSVNRLGRDEKQKCG